MLHPIPQLGEDKCSINLVVLTHLIIMTRQLENYLRLSGLEPLVKSPNINFMNIGERTNITGSKKFARLILNDQYDEAIDVARQQVEN